MESEGNSWVCVNQSMIRAQAGRGLAAPPPLWPPACCYCCCPCLPCLLFLLCTNDSSTPEEEGVGGSATEGMAGEAGKRQTQREPWMPSHSLTCACISPVGPAQIIEPCLLLQIVLIFFHLSGFFKNIFFQIYKTNIAGGIS
jgi:hypothetical protein